MLGMATCIEADCDKKTIARGWCGTHYARLRRAGQEGKPIKFLSINGKCSMPSCGKPHLSRGFCSAHYSKLVRHGNAAHVRAPGPTSCSVDGCSKGVRAVGFCSTHYQRFRHNGSPLLTAADVRRAANGGKLSKRYRYRGKRLEHRVVMERTLGRPLLPNENVHHINGQRFDNRAENLELWAKTQPSGQRVEDLVAWAKEILKTYAQDVQGPDSDCYRSRSGSISG